MKKRVITTKDVKKLFKGKEDITLKAMSDLAFYMGFKVEFALQPKKKPLESDDAALELDDDIKDQYAERNR